MNNRIFATLIIFGLLSLFHPGFGQESQGDFPMGTSIKLPEPSRKGDLSLEEALSLRRSRRDLASGALTLNQVSQILWAAQGVTSKRGFRTAPSAGALFPIEIYLVAEEVDGLKSGLYHYIPDTHSLTGLKSGSLAESVSNAALGQKALTQAGIIVVITADVSRTAKKYEERAERYVAEEVGAIAQNIYLQVECLGLATVLMGAFDDEKVQEALGITETPFGIMPIGQRTKNK
jgi:SagB-type dehydrogenase family enzyme